MWFIIFIKYNVESKQSMMWHILTYAHCKIYHSGPM